MKQQTPENVNNCLQNDEQPKAEEFPLSFKLTLRLAYGGRSVPDRVRAFRAWWRSELERMAKINGTPAVDNAAEVIGMFKKDGVDAGMFNMIRIGLTEWKQARYVDQKRQAALSMWAKARAKKVLPASENDTRSAAKADNGQPTEKKLPRRLVPCREKLLNAADNYLSHSTPCAESE